MAADELLTHDTFVKQLCASVPEVQAEAREHLDYYDELLLHLLMSDLLRTAVRLFHAGELEVEQRLLRFLDLALRQGDEAVQNAVAVSFVEDAGCAAEETSGFLASWPPGLRAELNS